MPITSHQIGGMIGGQQAMFGNFASYSQQITPGGGKGIQPTYSNPMGGGGGGASSPYAMESNIGSNMGMAGTSAAGSIAAPMIGAAAMAGSFLPGKAGGAFGMMDPTMAGMSGFGAGSGLNFGGKGMMSRAGWSHMGGAASRIASGGIGGIARAGMMGVAGGMIAAAPAMAIGAAAQYAGGQMSQGAQFQNQVHGSLQQNFRHLNPQSQTGYGFSREQTGGIADMVRTMGNKDAMSGPQELLRIMKQGVGMGQFRAVQDAKEFKTKFKEMVNTLKSISEDMSTTLEGAMPFLQKSKQMGFWTPQDIQKGSNVARGAAQATGMSIAQTQGMMGQGAAMARQVGALGATGAQGMARTMGLVGGGIRSGVVSAREMSEATGGLQGSAAIQSMSGSLQRATTRFSAGRTGRWLLAAMGNKGFTGFSQSNLQKLMSGSLSIGQIGRMARKNIGKQGAFNFVQNEQNLRGQLLKQGPGAQLGLIKGLIGDRLYGTGSKDKYITKRLMKRYFGVGGRQGDILAKLARSAPEILQQNRARSAAVLDQQERSRDEMMNNSYEGLKRKAATWWDKNVKDPLQKFGSDMSRGISDWFESASDKVWGRSSRGFKPRGISRSGLKAMQAYALGDTQRMQDVMGKSGETSALLGGAGGPKETSMASMTLGTNRGMLAGLVGTKALLGKGVERGIAFAGIGLNTFGKSKEQREEVEKKGLNQLRAASRGVAAVTDSVAKSLGSDSGQIARAEMRAAAKDMSKSSYIQAAAKIKREFAVRKAKNQAMSIKSLGLSINQAEGTGQEMAGRLYDMIKSGEIKGANLQKLIAKKNKQEGSMAIIASQAGSKSAISMKVEGAAGDLIEGGGTAQEKSRRLQDITKGAAGIIAASTSGGGSIWSGKGGPADRQKAIMGLYKGPAAKQFRAAMTLMAKGGSPEAQARAKEKARDMLSNMGQNMELSPLQRKVLTQMGDANHPESKAIAGAAKVIGKTTQGLRRIATKEVLQRRINRLNVSMGDKKDEMMTRMDELVVNKGAKSGEGKETMKDVVEGLQGGKLEPEEMMDRLSSMARMAAGAEGDDIEKVAKMQADLAAMPGGEMLSEALAGGIATRGAIKSLTGKSRKDKLKSANILSAGIGAGAINKQAMAGIQKGDKASKAEKAALSKYLAGSKGETKKQAEMLVKGIREGKEGVVDLMKIGISGATRRGASSLSDKDDTLKKQLGKLRPDSAGVLGGVGGLGSAKGRHLALTKMTDTLDNILDAIKKNGPTGNETDDPKKK